MKYTHYQKYSEHNFIFLMIYNELQEMELLQADD